MLLQAHSNLIRMTIGELLDAQLSWNPTNRILPKVQKQLIDDIMRNKMLTFIQVGSDGLIGNGHRRTNALYTGLVSDFLLEAEDKPELRTKRARQAWAENKAKKVSIQVQVFKHHTAADIYKIVNSSAFTKVTRSRDRLESFYNSDYNWDVLDDAAQRQFAKIAVMFELGIHLDTREIEEPDYSKYSDHREPSAVAKKGFEEMLKLKLGAPYIYECHGYQRYITPDRIGSRSTKVCLADFVKIVYKTGFVTKLRALRKELKLRGHGGYYPHDDKWDSEISNMFAQFNCLP